jgi:hypothetical protein
MSEDTPTIYIAGEYYPAKWEWHDNDVVSQWVLVALIEENEDE